MSKMTILLKELGEITGETIFIDGTKIEAYANKYTFVWKKAVSKNMEKMGEKISVFVNNCVKDLGIQVTTGTDLSLRFLKKMRKKPYAIKHERKIKFVHGIGRKKNKLQKAVEGLSHITEICICDSPFFFEETPYRVLLRQRTGIIVQRTSIRRSLAKNYCFSALRMWSHISKVR